MYEIHEQAKLSIDSRGEDLLGAIEPAPPRAPGGSFNPDVHVDGTISAKDLISIGPILDLDEFGEPVGLTIFHGQVAYGLYREDFKRLVELAESIAKAAKLAGYVSQDSIRSFLYEWLEKSHRERDNTSLTEYVIDRASQCVSRQEVISPIWPLVIEESFAIGKVHFKTITRQMIDQMKAQWVRNQPGHEDEISRYFEDRIRKFQGYAAATMSIEADPHRAKEIFLEESRRSLLALRMFTPASFHPRVNSVFDLWGSVKTSSTILLYCLEDHLDSIDEGITNNELQPEMFNRERIQVIMNAGLRTFSELIGSDSRTPFGESLMDAFLLFAKCTTAKDPADKLVYILVALESILLKDSSEPIQQNLAERMAFLLEESAPNRKQVIATVKKIYSIRSNFIHHGESIDDFDSLEKFMVLARRTIDELIAATQTTKTKEELIERLEILKLS